jgi:hypothetical protein
MKTRIATLVATVAIIGALFAGPALAHDDDDDGYRNNRWHHAEEWREHHPYQRYGDVPYSRYGYPWYGRGYADESGRYAYGYPGYRSYPGQGWYFGRGWHHDYDHDGD